MAYKLKLSLALPKVKGAPRDRCRHNTRDVQCRVRRPASSLAFSSSFFRWFHAHFPVTANKPSISTSYKVSRLPFLFSMNQPRLTFESEPGQFKILRSATTVWSKKQAQPIATILATLMANANMRSNSIHHKYYRELLS